MQDKQSLIRDTNQDAISCKLSAISQGYFQDEISKLFALKRGEVIRKQPVINRGNTACRHIA